jgi:hypothetical protein
VSNRTQRLITGQTPRNLLALTPKTTATSSTPLAGSDVSNPMTPDESGSLTETDPTIG